jgi:hypothetical protein
MVVLENLKIYAFNFVALALSFTNMDTVLKIILLLVTIGFTVDKWLLLRKRKRNK